MTLDLATVPGLALADFGEPTDLRAAAAEPATRVAAVWDADSADDVGQGFVADASAVLLGAADLPAPPAPGHLLTRDPDGAAPVTWEVVARDASGNGIRKALGLWWVPVEKSIRPVPGRRP